MKRLKQITESFFKNTGSGHIANDKLIINDFKESFKITDNMLSSYNIKLVKLQQYSAPVYIQKKSRKCEYGYPIEFHRKWIPQYMFTELFILRDGLGNEMEYADKTTKYYQVREDIKFDDKTNIISNIFLNRNGKSQLKFIEIDPKIFQFKSLSQLFQDCDKLEEVVMPDNWGGVESCMAMFQGCISLKNIQLPSEWNDEMRLITMMFSRCTSLENIVLPQDWKKIINSHMMLPTSIKYIDLGWNIKEKNLHAIFPYSTFLRVDVIYKFKDSFLRVERV